MYTIEIEDLSRSKQIIVETNISSVQSVNGEVGSVNINKQTVGLNFVDNTPDLQKPVSYAVSGALLDLEQRILSKVQLAQNEDIEFQVVLPSGIDYFNVLYPISLPSNPKSVNCSMENNIDGLIYSHSISNVTNSGFNIEFSDFLSSDGYILHVIASV